jgi:hypothetical protein
VTQFRETFKSDYKGAPTDVKRAVDKALRILAVNPSAGSLRLHKMIWNGPTVFKIDVFTNHSWQISFEVENGIATLRRLSRHKDIDRDF